MKYMSTRGAEKGLSFEDVLLAGYASDGGLYMPESIPSLDKAEMESWSSLSYPDVVKRVLRKFISAAEISDTDLSYLVAGAFNSFDIAEVVKVAELPERLNVAELFHGPTLTFKDLGLSIIARLYEYFLEKRKRHMIALVGTSGDTGSAAIHAVRDMKYVDIVVLLPKGRCTDIQERQMTTVMADNVHNFAVEGTSDDLDVPIKALFGDWKYKEEHNLCSINSLNWARVLVQIAHFVYCYYRVCESVGKEVEFVIPTGACGNITGCILAKSMGFPLRAVSAVNSNDIVHRTLSTGDFSMSADIVSSWSSAMDISVAYNLERLFLLSNNYNRARVKEVMDKFEDSEKVQLTEDAVNQLRKIVPDSASYTNDEVLTTIKQCRERTGYTVCPHTAVGVKYHFEHPTNTPRVCIATASAAKFPEALSKAGVAAVEHDTVKAVLTLPVRHGWMKKGEDWEKILRSKVEEISAARKKII